VRKTLEEPLELLRGGRDGKAGWNQRRKSERIPSLDGVNLAWRPNLDLENVSLRDSDLGNANL